MKKTSIEMSLEYFCSFDKKKSKMLNHIFDAICDHVVSHPPSLHENHNALIAMVEKCNKDVNMTWFKSILRNGSLSILLPYIYWYKYGKNMCIIGNNMMDVMSKTDVNLFYDDISMPIDMDAIYFDLTRYKEIIDGQRVEGALLIRQHFQKRLLFRLWTTDNDTATKIDIVLDDKTPLMNQIDFYIPDRYSHNTGVMQDVMRIVLNMTIYWSSHDRDRYLHPNMKALIAKKNQITARYESTKNRRYKKKLERELSECESDMSNYRHVYFIETKPLIRYEKSESKGTHKSPAQHLRRGHWRKLQTGRIVWIRPCIVNASSNKSTKIKEWRSIHDAIV